jgi:hypothetical protein
VGLAARERDAPATAGGTPALRISVRPRDWPSAKGLQDSHFYVAHPKVGTATVWPFCSGGVPDRGRNAINLEPLVPVDHSTPPPTVAPRSYPPLCRAPHAASQGLMTGIPHTLKSFTLRVTTMRRCDLDLYRALSSAQSRPAASSSEIRRMFASA